MNDHPIRILLSDQLERSRWTVFFRWLLAIPLFIWAGLWTIAAFFAALLSWFATLVMGRSPGPLHRFLASYVKYMTQVYAYTYLAANPYPSFDAQDGYPVDLAIAPPQRQSRWKVALRALLLLPAALIALALLGAPSTFSSASSRNGSGFSAFPSLLVVVAFLAWFAILVRGRMPRGLRDAAVYCISYGAQFWGYALLLTDRYPNSDPLAAVEDLPERADPIHLELGGELRRSRLMVFFRLPLVVPHLIWLELWTILVVFAVLANWFAVLFTGHSPARLHGFLSRYLRYQVHLVAFLYLIANPFPGFTGASGSYPVEVVVAEPDRQSRWTAAFRLLLAIPALILATGYGSLLAVVAVLGWFAALATGKMPRGLRNAGALAMRYAAQNYGYLMLLSDSYPYSGPSLNAGSDAAAPVAPVSTPWPGTD